MIPGTGIDITAFHFDNWSLTDMSWNLPAVFSSSFRRHIATGGLGTLLILLTVSLVACGGNGDDNGAVTPDPPGLDPPELIGAFDALLFEPESSLSEERSELVKELDLTDIFEGDELSYSATSEDAGVVSVSVDEAVATVAPEGGGETTLTFTAENDAGEESDTVTATVNLPSPPNQPPS